MSRTMRWAVAALAAAVLGSAAVPVRAAGLEGIPGYDHVVIVVLENESYASTWGPGSVATYINSLKAQGSFADQYFATGHVSLDNYVAMTSGQPNNQVTTGTDCLALNLYTCVQSQDLYSSGRNIADQLEGAGLSWKGYMDSMPSPCFHADPSMTATPPDPVQGNSTIGAGNYADRHNPFIYYNDVITNAARCSAHDVPYTQLGADLAANALPNFGFITPDTCHDGHDAPCAGNTGPGGLLSADLWMSQQMPQLISWLTAHNGLLLITTDEAATSDTSGCCTGGPGGIAGTGGRVGLLALGAGVPAGNVTHTQYDHMSMLRTVEDSFGISEHLNNAGSAGAEPLTGLFAPATNVPELPLLPLAAVAGLPAAWLATRRRRR